MASRAMSWACEMRNVAQEFAGLFPRHQEGLGAPALKLAPAQGGLNGGHSAVDLSMLRPSAPANEKGG
jgi:hypothetical protein